VPADETVCIANASVTCGAVSQLSNCSAPAEDVGGGWGIFVSILCDIFISVGLGLQVRAAAAPGRPLALPIRAHLFARTPWFLRAHASQQRQPDLLTVFPARLPLARVACLEQKVGHKRVIALEKAGKKTSVTRQPIWVRARRQRSNAANSSLRSFVLTVLLSAAAVVRRCWGCLG